MMVWPIIIIYPLVMSAMFYFMNRHFGLLRAARLKKDMRSPEVVGFAVIEGSRVRMGACDPGIKNPAIIISLSPDAILGNWHIAVTKKRIYQLSLVHRDRVLYSNRRNRWLDAVIVPIINKSFNSDSE